MFRSIWQAIERAFTPPAPRMPAQGDTTPIPERMATADAAGQADERARAARARGRASLLLTGGEGATDAPALARPQAGGAARMLLG